MPHKAYLPQRDADNNPEQELIWRPIGYACSRLVAAAVRKLGVAA